MTLSEVTDYINSLPIAEAQKTILCSKVERYGMTCEQNGFDDAEKLANRFFNEVVGATLNPSRIKGITDAPPSKANPDKPILTAGHDVC